MPDIATRPFEASELIDYGRCKFDPRAYSCIRRELLEMGLPENTQNIAKAVHVIISRELDGIEATFSRLKELRKDMEGMQINSGSLMINLKIPTEDRHRFNVVLYDFVDDAKFILNRWHRFVQASTVRGQRK
jgi:hypothetical protein